MSWCTIVAEADSGDTALDLYAGVGLFSTVLSQRFAQVIAVESSQTSHADLLYNSPSNVKAVRAATADFLRSPRISCGPTSWWWTRHGAVWGKVWFRASSDWERTG